MRCQARNTEARRQGAHLAIVNRTCSKIAGCRVGQPGRAPPRSAGSEGHGGGESNRGGMLPSGSHLTPLSACFLICKMGEYCLPQGVAVRVKSEKMVHISAHGGPTQSRAGDLAVRASPGTGREHPLRAQTGQDGPCHGKLPGRRGDGRAALTLAGMRGAGGGDRRARSSGRSQVTAFPTLTSGFLGVGREGQDPAHLPLAHLPHLGPCTAQARPSGPAASWGSSAACPHQLCDLQLPKPRALICINQECGQTSRHSGNHSNVTCTKRPPAVPRERQQCSLWPRPTAA